MLVILIALPFLYKFQNYLVHACKNISAFLGLFEHFLEFHFYLFVVFQCLCIAFLSVCSGYNIIVFIHIFAQCVLSSFLIFKDSIFYNFLFREHPLTPIHFCQVCFATNSLSFSLSENVFLSFFLSIYLESENREGAEGEERKNLNLDMESNTGRSMPGP